jgi:hypothetical protein
MVNWLCKVVVQDELEKMGLHPVHVELGKVEILEKITHEQHEKIKITLLQIGLELIDVKKKTRSKSERIAVLQ